jgi:rod shape-determining protein MreD
VRPILDSAWLRMTLVMILVLAVQLSLMPGLRIAGASADLMLLFALAGAMVTGPERGAVLGFFVGLGFDLFLTTPFALSALTYCLAGWVVGRVQVGILKNSAAVPMVTVGAATAVSVVAYALLARVFGDALLPTGTLIRVVLVETAFNVFFAPVALRICRWALATSLEARSASV